MTPPQWLIHAWRKQSPWLAIFAPLSWLFGWLSGLNKSRQRARVYHPSSKVIVVGNISLGGCGKTTMVQWLADYLVKNNKSVTIISKGYGRTSRLPTPQQATPDAAMYGDEPAMLAASLPDVTVIVCDSRQLAIEAANTEYVICDDGLQDYSFAPRTEIALIDGTIGHGNARLFPWGFLREKVTRLESCDLILQQGGNKPVHPAQGIYKVITQSFTNLGNGKKLNLDAAKKVFDQQSLYLCTALANNQRVHDQLTEEGITTIHHAFADHYAFQKKTFANLQGNILLTAKDAIKCQGFYDERMWRIDINLSMPQKVQKQLERLIVK